MIVKRVIPLFVTLVIFLLSFSVFTTGCSLTCEKPLTDLPIDSDFVEEKPPYAPVELSSELPPEFDIITEIWGILSRDYIDRGKLDAKKLSHGAAKGMMEALDEPYTAHLTPEAHQIEMSGLRGKYQGIGAYVGIKDGQLTIVTPIVGSPAEKAGIKAGDKILEINGEPTSGMTPTGAALKIQGPAGTTVDLLILHQGESEPVGIEIVRGEIKLESVIWEMRDDIAYIRITQFLESTGGDFHAALKDVIKKGANGIVLDLRNNPGGILAVVVDVASQFLAEGVVVDIVDSEGACSSLLVEPGGIATDLPLIVLVNDGSASGSEVLAGALHDYGRAELAGSQTFGKGSVQTIRSLKDGSALHLTTARWFIPSGKSIDGVGLTPDFLLELEGEELVVWAIDYLKSQIAASCLSVRV